MADGFALAGACNCGAVRYTITAPPLSVMACHCTSCRRQSGSAFSVNLIIRTEDMAVEGTMASWEDRDTSSGAPLSREFCGTCGSPIRSVPSVSPQFLAVKAGTLVEPDRFAPSMHIWTSSALPWVVIPADLPRFAQGPQ